MGGVLGSPLMLFAMLLLLIAIMFFTTAILTKTAYEKRMMLMTGSIVLLIGMVAFIWRATSPAFHSAHHSYLLGLKQNHGK